MNTSGEPLPVSKLPVERPTEPSVEEEPLEVQPARGTREKRTIALRGETWNYIDSMTKILGHEDTEETILTLVDLGMKAVQLTTSQDRLVKMLGGTRQVRGEKCKTCGYQQVVHQFEAAVQLGENVKPRPRGKFRL